MNAFFGRYLRIKPKDNLLIFLFAKVRESSLIQSINIFMWATFTLYSTKYAILDQFWAFFWEHYPLDNQQYLKTSCQFQILMKYILLDRFLVCLSVYVNKIAENSPK